MNRVTNASGKVLSEHLLVVLDTIARREGIFMVLQEDAPPLDPIAVSKEGLSTTLQELNERRAHAAGVL